MGPAVGIDLGTCYSCIGSFQNGMVEIIPNSYGKRVTPSYVAFNGEDRLLGESAFMQSAYNPENTVYEVKRFIGRNFEDALVQADAALLPFRIVKDNDKIKVEVQYHGETKKFLPEEISSFVLSHMKQFAENHLETEVNNAVITVPAYFNNTQRQATKDAGEIAGFNVMRIINEPTAAAIAYGLDKIADMKEARNVLVFDLGGGTFDVSILSMQHDDENLIDVLAVDGDTHLGGADFTNKLVVYMQHQVKSQHGQDIAGNKRALRRLYISCEKAKIRLSSHTEATIELDELLPNLDFCYTITQKKFEDLCQNLFLNLVEPLETVLKESKLSKSQIDDIVLVGGSIRIPKVQDIVSTFFDGKELNTSINPDEAIAYGATVQASILNDDQDKPNDFVLLDVLPLTLGFGVRDGSMMKLIKRNSKIPTQKSWIESFEVRLSDGLQINILEGERLLKSENNHLGDVNLNTKKGEVSRCQITFEVDTNGILSVSAEEHFTGDTKHTEITRDSRTLTQKEVSKHKQEAAQYRKDDEKEIQRLHTRNKLATACANIPYKMRMEEEFKAIQEKDKKKMQKKCEEIEVWIRKNENENSATFDLKRKELLTVWTNLVNHRRIVLPTPEKDKWQKEESLMLRRVEEFVRAGDKYYQKKGNGNYKAALKYYGKAFSTAAEKGLTSKQPDALHKMGLCWQRLAETEEVLVDKVRFAKHASVNFGAAIRMCRIIGDFKSKEWINEVVQEASEGADFYFDNILPQIEDSTQRILQAGAYAQDLSWQPCHELMVKVDRLVALLCFDIISDLLKRKEHNLCESYLQQMLISMTRAEERFGLQNHPDASVGRDLKLLRSDYQTSKDIIEAWQAMDAGYLITNYAMKEMGLGFDQIRSALNLAWNARDKFKDSEHLSEGIVDEIYFQSKTAQAFLFLNIFKNEKKAKNMYKEILESSASQNFINTEWLKECKSNLKSLEAKDPAFQKQKIQEDLNSDVDRIKQELKSAANDKQKFIDFIFRNFPPIPNNNGTLKLKPVISKLGETKALKKMIYSYHPDKIDKSDLRYKLLCEEITKVFTELLDS